jgi:hypothetical protein
MERLRFSAWRVREVRMGRAQVSCELVQCVASDEDADWDIEDAVLGVELLDDGATALAVIANNTAASIEAFVRANVKPGATLLTDGHASYPGLTDYRHDPRIVGKMAAHIALPWIHQVFALVKRWGLGTYHGLRRNLSQRVRVPL